MPNFVNMYVCMIDTQRGITLKYPLLGIQFTHCLSVYDKILTAEYLNTQILVYFTVFFEHFEKKVIHSLTLDALSVIILQYSNIVYIIYRLYQWIWIWSNYCMVYFCISFVVFSLFFCFTLQDEITKYCVIIFSISVIYHVYIVYVQSHMILDTRQVQEAVSVVIWLHIFYYSTLFIWQFPHTF